MIRSAAALLCGAGLLAARVTRSPTGRLTLRGGLRGNAIPIILCAAAYPFERHAQGVDAVLQDVTARLALILAGATGLSLELEQFASPTLMGAGVLIRVAPECAGAAPFLAIFTLALTLANVLFTTGRAQVAFVLWAVPMTFAGNVARVVASSHLAVRWAADTQAWQHWHDGVGYVALAASLAPAYALARFFARAGGVPDARVGAC